MTVKRAGTPETLSFEPSPALQRIGQRPSPVSPTIVAVALAVGALASVSGCAGMRFQPDAGHRVEQQAELPSAKDPIAESQRESLAAIEDFLARTKQYRSDSAPTSAGQDHPATPGMIPEIPFKRASSRPHPASADNLTLANGQLTINDGMEGLPRLAIPALQEVSIRWDDPNGVKTPEPIQSNATNSPLEARPDEPYSSLSELVEHLRSRSEEHRDFDTEWRLRIVQLALDRDQEATDVSAMLSEGTRSLLGALVKAAIAVRNMARNPMLTGEEALARLDALRQLVADRADPMISTAALCRKVVTFGVYDEMDADDWIAGRSIQAIVYSEIRNLRSLQTEDGQFETRLASRLEVFTANGESVWQRSEPEIVDTCRRRRSDFFIAQRITLPPTLPAGDYVLKVLVEDTLSGRADETSQSFRVISPISVAKRP